MIKKYRKGELSVQEGMTLFNDNCASLHNHYYIYRLRHYNYARRIEQQKLKVTFSYKIDIIGYYLIAI